MRETIETKRCPWCGEPAAVDPSTGRVVCDCLQPEPDYGGVDDGCGHITSDADPGL